MSQKIPCAVIGSGNIGTDLLYKLLRSKDLEPAWMVGRSAASKGLAHARELNIKTTHHGIDGLLPHLGKSENDIRIAFDATSARSHVEISRKLTQRGVKVIDLTPAAIGPYCVPPVNLKKYLDQNEDNINMVTCGGQATIPMIHAISRIQSVSYGEIVSAIASKSAGPGTRKNIDEFTQTTSRAIEKVGGAAKGKAIIILNPAEPPLVMRSTIHCLTKDTPDRISIIESVKAMEQDVQAYVPGYRLKEAPVFDSNRVSLFVEVRGCGDFLPEYAGNLDIMTAAAVRSGEMLAASMLSEYATPLPALEMAT